MNADVWREKRLAFCFPPFSADDSGRRFDEPWKKR